MELEPIQIAPPCLGEEEIAEVVDTLRSGWLSTGPKVGAFEEGIREYVGSSSALATNSCTAALHLALIGAGVGPGDEVVTTPMTFAASVNVIEHVGAVPVLVDVEADTLNLDPRLVEMSITPKTAALLPVHYAGHPAELGQLARLAGDAIPIVEDAAHAIGAEYEGVKIGSHGNLTAFSFYATKNLTTGEGGMLVGPQDVLDRLRILSLHGMSRDAWKRYDGIGQWYYEVLEAGYKYNMTDIQASIGIHQLKRFGQFQARRQEIARRYNERFAPYEQLEIPTRRGNVKHAWHLYPLRLRLESLSIDRAQFIAELAVRGIGATVHFIPIHLHPYYRDRYGYLPSDFPIAQKEFERLVSLPIYPCLGDDGVDRVVDAVTEIVEAFRR